LLFAGAAFVLALLAPQFLSNLPLAASPAGQRAAAAVATAPRAAPASLGPREQVIAADAGGQYSLDVLVGGQSARMMVDTGATLVTLSADTAQRIGLPLTDASYTGRTQTANGIGRAAPVTLSAVSIGDIYVPTVQGMVLDRSAGDVNLLGMSFLRRLSAVEQKSGRLVLRQ